MQDGSLGRTALLTDQLRHFVTKRFRSNVTMCNGAVIPAVVDDEKGESTPTCLRCWCALLRDVGEW